MPQLTEIPYSVTHFLGVNPPGMLRDYAKKAPAGLPTWSVTLATQNTVTQHVPFFYSPGRGPQIQLALTHNMMSDGWISALFTIEDELKLMFGKRWWSNVQMCLEFDEDNDKAIIRMPDLRLDIYEPTANPSVWKPIANSGVFHKLEMVSGGFELETLPDHTKYRFEPKGFELANERPLYQLVRITDPIGQYATLNWDAQDPWKLRTITDASNRITTFRYGPSDTGNRVTKIEIFSGSGLVDPEITYDSFDRIETVKNQRGDVTTYTYYIFQEQETTALASISYEKGIAPNTETITAEFNYIITFDEYGLGISVDITDFNGDVRSYQRSLSAPTLLTLTDELGNITEYSFNGDGFAYKITEVPADPEEEARSSYAVYDPALRLPIRTIDRNLRVVDMEYDNGQTLDVPRGNLTKLTQWMGLFSGNPNTDPMAPMSGDNIVTTHQYNSNDDPTVTVEAAGTPLARTTTNEYGDGGFPHNVTKIIDALNRETVNEYWASGNGAGKLKKSTDRNGNATQYDYDSNWNVQYIKDPLWSAGDPDKHRTTLGYDTLDRLISERNDSLRQTVSHLYDELHRETRTTFPNGTYIENTYDTCDLVEERDQAGNPIAHEYDNMSREVSTTDQEGRETTQEWDEAGNRIKLTFAGETTEWEYDHLGRVTKETNPLDQSKEFAYDELDMNENLIRNTEKNEDGDEIKRAYDALGRLRRIEPPDSAELVTIEYDELNRRTEMHEPTGTVTWAYSDVLSSQITVTTPQATNPTVYDNDAEGRRVKLTNPDGDILSYWYDAASNLLSIRDGALQTDPAWAEFDYDGGNRLTEKRLRNGVKITVAYDDTQGTDSTGMNRITDLKYFHATFATPTGNGLSGSGSQQESLFNDTCANFAGAGGKVKKLTLDAGLAGGDGMEVWVELKKNGGTVFTSAHEQVPEEKSPFTVSFDLVPPVDFAATDTIEVIVHASGTEVDLKAPFVRVHGIGLAAHLQYPSNEYDALGNRLRMNRVKFPSADGRFGNGSYVTYGYDKTAQLTNESYFLADNTKFLENNYPYDEAGNRGPTGDPVSSTDHGIEKQLEGFYDAANQLNLLSRKNPSQNLQFPTTFAHDLRGNRTQKVQPAGAGLEAEQWHYTFNIFNKLTKVEITKLGVKTEFGFKYGADGYRVEKFWGTVESPTDARKFIMDGVHVILEKDAEGETKVRYIPGVCMITRDYNNQPVIRYYLQDALGSNVAMTDEEQNITALYQSDAWGNELLATEDIPNPYRWNGASGYYRDNDAQLYLLGMRWYDAETGRFVSRDPIGFDGGDNNFFAYTNNSPVSYTDPRGIARISPPSALDVICLPFILLALRAVKSARNDLYKHCVLGCVIARRCGFIYCGLAGILKEDWDYYTGLGTPDWDDLEATLDGCLISFKWGTCENLCKGKFNPNLRR